MDLLLIEGLPGTGKTTLIQRLSEKWGKENCAGFYTSEFRERGRRSGFLWETFDGRRGILAKVGTGSPRVGKYQVQLGEFEEMLNELRNVEPGKRLLIDEVGKMECFSNLFRDLLPEWERYAGLRIFTVPVRGTPFIDAFKERNRSNTLQLTKQNRDELFDRILKKV